LFLTQTAVGTGLTTESDVHVLGVDLGGEACLAEHSPERQRLLRNRISEGEIRQQLMNGFPQPSALLLLQEIAQDQQQVPVEVALA
jgi:hypothetical protein